MSILETLAGVSPAPSRAPGLAVGLVTSLEDPDNLGRVKVRLADWDAAGADLGFLRVMTPMAGAGWGVQLLPEVGDEVVVGFCGEGGESPLVLGSLWNGKSAQPAALEQGANDVRVIRTRSGHQLLFSDKEEEQYVTLSSAGGLTVRLDDKAKLLTLADPEGKNKLSIDVENGCISITAEKKLCLTADQCTVTLDGDALAVESGGALELKGQDVTADAKGGLTLKAGQSASLSAAKMDLEASGAASVKGMTLQLN